MKKVFCVVLALFAVGAVSCSKDNKFQVIDAASFKMHVYNSGDVMADASYIVETKSSLVTMEEPLFKTGVAEFNAYLNKLGKPVAYRITDYHEGGTGANPVVKAEGMTKFMSEGVYDAMMKGFQKNFGDTMADRPTGKSEEIKFGDKLTVDGVDFEFQRGAASDFPGASILIGKKFYLTHWAPAKSHMSPLRISGPAAVDAELAESNEAAASGAEYFIGGHGGCADRSALDFQIDYLKKIGELLKSNSDAEAFAAAMKQAYPNLAGEENLEALAQNLYKK